jgi:lipoprotein-anchoring transpeptidase ErfK/SrfK
VFRQNSENPDNLSPINIFENGATNRALVSSANFNKFQNCGKSKNRPCTTPTGDFNIDLMEVMHHSSRFQNAPMPWSMFFMGSVGIAIHGATPSEYKDLGKKASHGCIRIHPDNGHLLFNLVKSEGGTRSGAVVQIH